MLLKASLSSQVGGLSIRKNHEVEAAIGSTGDWSQQLHFDLAVPHVPAVKRRVETLSNCWTGSLNLQMVDKCNQNLNAMASTVTDYVTHVPNAGGTCRRE